MSALLLVKVYGKPVTQGSKTRTRWGMRDDNVDRLKPWRVAVSEAALSTLEGVEWVRAEGPVRVEVAFTFDRPKSAPKSRKYWQVTRSSGDVDKLTRAVFDSLTAAGVWRDDSLVVDVRAVKLTVGGEGALHIPGACVRVSLVDLVARAGRGDELAGRRG